MNDKGLASRIWALLVVVAAVWLIEQLVPLLQSISDILLLFFLAWLVAFVLEPLVTVQERLRVPRGLAVALVYGVLLLSLVLIFVLIGPPLVDQLGQLSDSLPRLLAELPAENDVTQFLSRMGLPARTISAFYRPDALAQQLQISAGEVLQGAIGLATSALTLVVNGLLLLIISYYMLLDGRKIAWAGLRLMPRQQRDDAMVFLVKMSSSFGGFLRGQVIQAILFALPVAGLLIVLGMEFVAVAALASALLMMIPLIGPVLALIPPLVVALFNPQGAFVFMLVVLVVVQFVIINILMPRILSGQMGMPPLLVFLAILLGLRMGGPLGAFFGIPIAGALYGTASVILNRRKNGDDEKQQQTALSAQTDQERNNST